MDSHPTAAVHHDNRVHNDRVSVLSYVEGSSIHGFPQWMNIRETSHMSGLSNVFDRFPSWPSQGAQSELKRPATDRSCSQLPYDVTEKRPRHAGIPVIQLTPSVIKTALQPVSVRKSVSCQTDSTRPNIILNGVTGIPTETVSVGSSCRDSPGNRILRQYSKSKEYFCVSAVARQCAVEPRSLCHWALRGLITEARSFNVAFHAKNVPEYRKRPAAFVKPSRLNIPSTNRITSPTMPRLRPVFEFSCGSTQFTTCATLPSLDSTNRVDLDLYPISIPRSTGLKIDPKCESAIADLVKNNPITSTEERSKSASTSTSSSEQRESPYSMTSSDDVRFSEISSDEPIKIIESPDGDGKDAIAKKEACSAPVTAATFAVLLEQRSRHRHQTLADILANHGLSTSRFERLQKNIESLTILQLVLHNEGPWRYDRGWENWAKHDVLKPISAPEINNFFRKQHRWKVNSTSGLKSDLKQRNNLFLTKFASGGCLCEGQNCFFDFSGEVKQLLTTQQRKELSAFCIDCDFVNYLEFLG